MKKENVMNNKYVKRFISILLAGTMVLTMAGCGKSKSEESEKGTQA